MFPFKLLATCTGLLYFYALVSFTATYSTLGELSIV